MRAAAIVLTLALGVGVNTAVYNVVRAVLMEPLPFRDPDRLVQIWETHPELPSLQVSAPDFRDWREQSASFDQMAAYTLQAMNKATLGGQGDPEKVQATMVSRELFPMLGVQPLLGRAFTPEDEREQRHILLLSEPLWRRKFSADPNIVGKRIQLNSEAFTVIGVVSGRQAFPVWADLWMPMWRLEPMLQETRRFHPLEVVGRLKPGVSEHAAQTELQVIAKRLESQYPATNGKTGCVLVPLAAQITGEVRPALLIIWAAVGLVLLIACANVAHLVMARAVDRSRELAIRAALGATRWRLIWYVLAENLKLAALGGALGLLVSVWSTDGLRTFAKGQIPRLDDTPVFGSSWIFAFSISLFCALLFAFPACRHAGRMELNQAMKPRRSRFGPALIMAEIALAFVVLTGAGLLVRSFAQLLHEDPGFRAQNILVADVPLPMQRYSWEAAGRFFETKLGPMLRALPGVDAVATTNAAPMSLNRTEQSRFATRFGIPGQIYEPGRFPVAQVRWISPDYFRVLGIPLLRGRLLERRDGGSNLQLVNETLAQRFFPGQDPIGKKLLLGVTTPKPNEVEIAGVVGDVRDLGLDLETQPTMYSVSTSPGMTVLVKTHGDPALIAPSVLETIRKADGEIAVGRIRTVEQYVASSLARRTFVLYLLGGFAILAGILTAVGIYGVIGYSVSRRVNEFGIRSAVGARPADLVILILHESGAMAIAGLAFGAFAAVLFSGVMKTLLYKLSPNDPLAFSVVGILLLGIALLAAIIPAIRAARTDPAVALRAQ
jgi:predicted permease